MSDDPKPADQTGEKNPTEARSEGEPLESEVARGNVHSKKHDEPELPTPPPLSH